MTAAVTPRAQDEDRLTRWMSASAARAATTSSVAYAAWQPAAHWLLHVGFHTPIAFHGAASWARFEVTVAVLGALAGCGWQRSRAWPRRTWRRDWAECAWPSVALGTMIMARALPATYAAVWVLAVLLGAALNGAVLGALTQLVRSPAPAPPTA